VVARVAMAGEYWLGADSTQKGRPPNAATAGNVGKTALESEARRSLEI